jgi:hypothetical protein
VGNEALPISHLQTVTASFGGINTHIPDVTLSTANNLALQGTTAIAATSANIFCTAMLLETAQFAPVGVALRGIRFNPVPGGQE